MAHADLRSIVFNNAMLLNATDHSDDDGVGGTGLDLGGPGSVAHAFNARLCKEFNASAVHPGDNTDANRAGGDNNDFWSLANHMFQGTTDGSAYDTGDDILLTGVSCVINESTGVNFVDFKARSITWPSIAEADAGDKASGVLIYRLVAGSSTPVEANDIPLCFIKFASAIDPDGSDLTVKWSGVADSSTSGTILKIQQAAV